MPDNNSFEFNNNTEKLVNNYNKRMVFNEKQQEKYKEILNVFDKDGNGLTKAEMKSLWTQVTKFAATGDKFTLDSKEAQAFINAHFKNGNVDPKVLCQFLNVVSETLTKSIATHDNGIPPKEKYTIENLKKYTLKINMI